MSLPCSQTKTTWELMRAWGVFSLSALKPVVNHHRELMGLGDKIVGTTMMNWFLRVRPLELSTSCRMWGNRLVAPCPEVVFRPFLRRRQRF